jgi:hypothetical protein
MPCNEPLFALFFFLRFLAAPRLRRFIPGLGELLTSPKPYRFEINPSPFTRNKRR